MLSGEQMREILNIGILLTSEKDKDKLLHSLLSKAMELTSCDAGTIYLYSDRQELEFKIMRTISMGVNRGEHGEVIDLPPVQLVEGNVCAYSAIHRELVNIEDVYYNDRFDFSGPRKYDALTGYRTQSMLVVPMSDMDDELVGVMQLMNAMEDGRVVPFTEESAFVLKSLSSQAAVTLTNMKYVTEIKRQLYSFVEAFATAIDQRTPYNGTHTRKVMYYAELLAKYINEQHAQGNCEEFFSEERMEQLILASALHDIGKMIVPLEVMNKGTRLERRMENMKLRYRMIGAYLERDCLKGKISGEVYEEKKAFLEESIAWLEQKDRAGFMSDEDLERVKLIASCSYQTEDGEVIPYLTPYEEECMSVRKGTLTTAEREQMESHVSMTKTILDKVYFNKHYKDVARIAYTHHEFLNGTGYPEHLQAQDLGLESRILTVADIYDALTSTDRPYKVPIPQQKALAILMSMADEGKIEKRLVEWLGEAVMRQ